MQARSSHSYFQPVAFAQFLLRWLGKIIMAPFVGCYYLLSFIVQAVFAMLKQILTAVFRGLKWSIVGLAKAIFNYFIYPLSEFIALIDDYILYPIYAPVIMCLKYFFAWSAPFWRGVAYAIGVPLVLFSSLFAAGYVFTIPLLIMLSWFLPGLVLGLSGSTLVLSLVLVVGLGIASALTRMISNYLQSTPFLGLVIDEFMGDQSLWNNYQSYGLICRFLLYVFHIPKCFLRGLIWPLRKQRTWRELGLYLLVMPLLVFCSGLLLPTVSAMLGVHLTLSVINETIYWLLLIMTYSLVIKDDQDVLIAGLRWGNSYVLFLLIGMETMQALFLPGAELMYMVGLYFFWGGVSVFLWHWSTLEHNGWQKSGKDAV